MQFNDLYVYAPKPQANRLRVDRSASRGTRSEFAKFVSDNEREELYHKRKETEREKQAFRLARARQKLDKPADGASTFQKATSAVVPTGTVAGATESLQSLLTDAQEQQALLTAPDTDGYISSTNKPEARSRITRGKAPTEDSARRLEQREKQLSYGYVTQGYQNYIKQIPKEDRGADDPKTPNARQVCSKRSWDGQLALWRRQLHKWDDEGVDSTTDDTPKRAPSVHVTAEEREELAKIRLAAKTKGQEKKASSGENSTPVKESEKENNSAA